MSKSQKKSNAIRILENAGVSYTLYEYSVDENDLTGISVALKIGADPDAVFKTLVTRSGPAGFFVFCIPVTTELDRKKAAGAAGVKNVELIKVAELFSLTGYIRGGCSPIGMKKALPVLVDETALLFDYICFSAGIRGMQVKTKTTDFLRVSGARTFDLI